MYNLLATRSRKPEYSSSGDSSDDADLQNSDLDDSSDDVDLQHSTQKEDERSIDKIGNEMSGLKIHDEQEATAEEEDVEGHEEVGTEVFDRKCLMRKKVPELKELLKSRGMSVNGKKKDLIDRLLGEEVDDDDNLAKNKMGRLKEKLKALNKPTRGTRLQLIKRLDGTEQFEEGSFDDYDRYTGQELVEKLKSQNKDTGGLREDLINRLMGKEPPMPNEAWQDSDDKVLLISKLQDGDVSNFRSKTAEQVHKHDPFNRWPFYKFREYFKSALLSVLKEEAIVDEDNVDFAALAAANPISERDQNGKDGSLPLH